jgi:hypothetical protein
MTTILSIRNIVHGEKGYASCDIDRYDRSSYHLTPRGLAISE